MAELPLDLQYDTIGSCFDKDNRRVIPSKLHSVDAGDLIPGDIVHYLAMVGISGVNGGMPVSDKLGACPRTEGGEGFSGYNTSYYPGMIVEKGGDLFFKTINGFFPANPASHGYRHPLGTLLPLDSLNQKQFYKLRK